MASRLTPRLAEMLASGLLRRASALRPVVAVPESLVCRSIVAPRLMPACLRAMHSSAASQSTALSTVLQAELDYERDEYSQPEEVAGGPPNGFVLTESQGDCLVTLTKQNGKETITVELIAGSEVEDDEEYLDVEEESTEQDEVVPQPLTPFAVSVAKGEIELRFEAQVRGDGSLEVTEVTLTPVDEDDEAFSEVPYQGPRFEELDGALQNEFLHYLDERGINRDLAIYLSVLNFDKEQREYTSWLERVQKFVNKTD